ncbi:MULTISPECIES: hypothetical protein [Providencia]|uniref:hypothetical protein n=1 Tax=Providencia TaxID=586 RepID=UPI0015EC6A94|nr:MULTISPECIES: hypothetical protein [unclassified Providencia]QLQ65045.1 hypothetical protein H0904_01000 [Providencia rettgeri]URR21248.1 hypothetical protein L3Q80_12885 [Providencia rettgeri]WOB99665.1 hypothetical protein P3L55_20990 [Providencia sp. PROV046]
MFSYKTQLQSLFVRLFVSAIGFLVSIIIVRLYSKEIVSDYFLYVSFGNLCAQILTFGCTPTINKLASEGVSFKKIIYKYITQYKPYFIFFVVSLLIISSLYSQLKLLSLAVVSILLFALLIQSEILKGRGDYLYSQLFTGAISNILFLMISIFLNKNFNITIHELILIWCISLIFSNLLCILVNSKYNQNKDIRGNLFDKNKTQKIYISMVIVYCFSQIDLWVVASFFDENIIAQYALSTRLALLLTFPLMAARNITASKIPIYINKDKAILQQEISKSCLFSFCISTLVLLFIIFFGKFIIQAIYSSEYDLVFYLLLIFAVGQLINSLTGPCDQLLTHTNQEYIYLKLTIFSFILLLFFILTLYILDCKNIYYYAFSVSFVIIIQNILISFYVYKRLHIISLPLRMKYENR